MIKIGIYPGTFDPITYGHIDVIKRALKIVNKLIVAVSNDNIKDYLFSDDERVQLIKNSLFKDLKFSGKKIKVLSFNTLTTSFCSKHRATIIIRGLRAASDDELKLVEDVCRRFNIQFLSARLQVTQKDGSLASGAREARYDALAEIAEQVGAKRVLTAHHADDQLETMLMALCRGGGLNQLAGMAKERPLNESVTLARPLLDVRKETLVDICTACLIPWCEDPTNKSLDTPRGKLRQSVIPTLRELYPSADKHATNASVLLHGLLQERASLIPQGLAWERAELSQFEHAIVSEAVHCALGTNATFETVQSIADAVKDDSTHERTFTCANGYIAKVTAHTVEVIHAN